jgi:putative ABC transport system permease protein
MPIVPRQLEKILRPLRRDPGFALAVVAILALGIGANTATLNLIYGYLLVPLPYPHAGRLVNVHFTSARIPVGLRMSYPTYFHLREETTGMVDSGMYKHKNLNLIEGAQAVHVRGAAVSASLFTTLGVRPLLGRTFGPRANQPGAASVVVLSYRAWARLFDRSPAALGRVVTVNGVASTVIGVMPRTFRFPDPTTDLWLPHVIAPFDREQDNLTAWNDTMVARLAPGVSAAQFAAQSQAVLEREIAHFPDPSAVSYLDRLGMRIQVTPLRSALVGALHERLILAQLATGLLLLLVWFNLANLFIARALRHRGELTVRRVLGAETRVLFRELLAESLVPSLAGGLAGLVLGEGLVRALLVSGFGNGAVAFPLRDWGTTAGLALGLALASALVFSLAALHFIRRQDLGQALRDADARSAGGPAEHRARAALAATQLALATALIGAGLLLAESLAKLDAVRLGFHPQHVLTFQVQIPPNATGTEPPDLVLRLAALHRALSQVPGVRVATVASDVPFDGQPGGNSVFPYPYHGRHSPTLDAVVVDPDYLRTFDMRLLAGREFAQEDGAPSRQGSAVIDAQAARELFGTTKVIGREFSFDDPNDTRPGLLFRVIGIVTHVRHAHVARGDQMGVVYVDRRQIVDPSRPGWSWAAPTWYVAVRTPLDPAAILPAVRRAVSAALPGVPVYDVRSMTARLARQLAPRRGMTALVLMFALGALVVATVGLYAVQSYSVGQRRPELGIRASLGADAARLRALVMREVMVLLAIGLTAGLCGMVALGRVLSSLLYDVRPADPLALVLVPVVLGATAVLAGWIPAQRASRVHPVEALRDR